MKKIKEISEHFKRCFQTQNAKEIENIRPEKLKEPFTRVVTKINGHKDKRSSKFSNLNSVNSKIAETKQQNRLKQCFS